MTIEQIQEHQERINLGDRARNFLTGNDWKDLVKPIVDSMIKGLVDIRDIKKTLLSSNKKAEILVEARAEAAEYLERIELLIDAYISDGEVSRKLLEKRKQTDPESLYRTEEEEK